MTRLATQRADVAEKWPTHVYYAQESFIAQNPNTLRALLRAHVRAIWSARANPTEAAQVLVEAVKFEPKYGKRAYDDTIEDLDERGRLPEAHMPIFWEIAKRTGDVTEPWPKEKFLDSRFIESYDQWSLRRSRARGMVRVDRDHQSVLSSTRVESVRRVADSFSNGHT